MCDSRQSLGLSCRCNARHFRQCTFFFSLLYAIVNLFLQQVYFIFRLGKFPVSGTAYSSLCPLVMLLESKTSHRTIFIAPRIPHVHRHDFSSQDALWLTPGSVYTYLASLRCNCQVREQRLTFRVSRGDTNTYTNNGVRSFASVTSRT